MSAEVEPWDETPPILALAPDEILVWRVPLDEPAADVAALRPLLAPEECARADRFLMNRDRVRFTVCRARLRLVLGRLLGVEPTRLAFRYGGYGKPALGEEFAGPGVEFNVSHSQGLALIAVARGRQLGVDIEAVRPLADRTRIVDRFFSPREVAEFHRVPEALRVQAFYHGWTRKEAYMKAVGAGFSLPLERFDVSLTPGEPPRLWRVEGQPQEPARWTFRDLDPGPGFQAALVVEGSGWRHRGFQIGDTRSVENGFPASLPRS